jgi:thiol-disulfide isomerase/thioredoxin
LQDFDSLRTVFLFVSPNCGPCRQQLPEYVRLAAGAVASGIEFVFVCESDAGQCEQLVREFGLAGRVLVAPRPASPFAREWNVYATPHFVAVEDGVVLDSGVPTGRMPAWSRLLRSMEAVRANQNGSAVQG